VGAGVVGYMSHQEGQATDDEEADDKIADDQNRGQQLGKTLAYRLHHHPPNHVTRGWSWQGLSQDLARIHPDL